MPLKPIFIFTLNKNIQTEEDLVESLKELLCVCDYSPNVLPQFLDNWKKDPINDLQYIILLDKLIDVSSLSQAMHCWDVKRDPTKTGCHSCQNIVRVHTGQDEGYWECDKTQKMWRKGGKECPEYSATIQNREGEPAHSIEEIFKSLMETPINAVCNKEN